MEVNKLFEKYIIDNNQDARFRAAGNVYIFNDEDIEYAREHNLQHELDQYEMIKSLMYKDIDGRRVYYQLNNDSIYLYIDCTNKPTEFLNAVEQKNLAERLNFAYSTVDFVKFAKESKSIVGLEDIFRRFNVSYSKVVIEPRGSKERAYEVLYNREEDRVYDVTHDSYDLSSIEFKKSVRDKCRVLGSL